jgi:hypothetical protein
VGWEIEGCDQFAAWYGDLTAQEQERVEYVIAILEQHGPTLGRPYVDALYGSRHSNMKELRVQVAGDPTRIFFAFDPRRTAILLIGGGKTGDALFYDRMIPIADDLYDEHLAEIQEENDGN